MINSDGLNRRDVLRLAVSSTAGLWLGRAACAADPFQVTDVATIPLPADEYHGWPTLTRRANGQLLVVCSGGRESHICPFGRVVMVRSDDDGQTWTWPRTLYDGPIDDRDAGVLETSQGTLLVTTFTSLAYEPSLSKAIANPDSWEADRLARWRGAQERITADERKAELGVWMIRSTDGGITWSARSPTIVNSPHGPIQLADGRLLYAGVRLWDERRKVGVCESTDDGKSWKWIAEMPVREGDKHTNYHELHAVEADNGRLIAHIRNHNQPDAGTTLQTESSDGGRTWTTPHSIGVWGLPSHLLKLADGRLLMSYGHRRQPFGNQVRLSEDHGKSWSDAMVIYGDGTNGDLGYPSTVQLADGSLVTVWYERMQDDPHARLRVARWALT